MQLMYQALVVSLHSSVNTAQQPRSPFLLVQVSELLSELAICRGPGSRAAVEGLVQQLSAALAQLPARVVRGQTDQGVAQLISSWGVNPQVGGSPELYMRLVSADMQT